ncbi:MAG: polyprenyl synthetase family protein [Desulfobacteraceae bacterium]|jgi:octaprenyl-diphosphate synthase|nr:polyprenyl synthetase family protein [Desulfobacteraceae bacterium]MDH3721831.1 polyprenyl synthetase family protein [Desulfobacteraceae bacterium]MDH3835876.1 polyprenyl synthetase family protein [Desulfobacteraceae bacterium]MDH3875080.1 polyprenyl synthetase family protein [Desulfobacteraceae bacterium]MDH3957090.1 polyprenyl synthetase family protein [Desulfobacteraceae bacterium]
MNDLKHKILMQVENDLEEIEVALQQNLNPYLDLVSQIAGHILFSGGKRLRPLLMVLSARICGYKGDYDKVFSTIFEYLHAATLLHDDLVDEATLRRGKPVANSIWGNAATVLVGDFLLARSLAIAAETKQPDVIKVVSGITENMSQGEIHQLMRKGSLDLTEAEYMEIIKRKTAVLFQGTCRSGALIADVSLTKETALSDYGFNLGIAFQMVDDLLDYTLDTATLGKEVGADLKEGKMTLPVIYSLKSADEKNRTRMENIIKNKNFSVNDFETLIKMIDKYGGQLYTQNLATEYVKNAKEALAVFQNSKTKEVLLMIADYTLSRNF